MDVHLPQHFVEEALLPPVIFLAPLSKVRWLQMCGLLHGSSVGSYWSACPLSHCVCYCDFLIQFEIRDGDTSAVAFSTQDWFGSSESLLLMCEF